jgi:hypothetical protein
MTDVSEAPRSGAAVIDHNMAPPISQQKSSIKEMTNLQQYEMQKWHHDICR